MQRRLRWVLVMMAVVTTGLMCSPATAAEPYLFYVIKKPPYARALKSLLDHAGNLPSWTRQVLKRKGNYVTGVVTYASVGGIKYEVFVNCQPHYCNTSKLAVMFAPDGAQAWGALLRDGETSYLGAPSEGQQTALREQLGPRSGYHLSDVLKMPAYARALKSLFDQTADLPDWAKEALKPDGDIFESAVDSARIGETVYEMFFECMPNHCDRSGLVLMFAPDGTQAWGALFDDRNWPSSFLGAPSGAQKAVLQEVLYSKRDSKREQ